ncbi:hypothetical protein NAEGRDRAFT_57375 [Naegleria gruberi]|uniref:Uncharacterized protein n=1 Tax=Naegleria gruberi TaxID=5762 RepID=D2V7F6_NAEGR|nr:uncharacterized protein NAEGRDRAFT_57375 [Naegleria gruberi]EFC47242.1 hypothetical protein NAEGRDRAFT_57375 [Naegleria gruberi]|eukprot:XP_002679986.1 hypothetical protein NAEGRDRAFT_57375 [Naegleria gruberi strain NEG-M]
MMNPNHYFLNPYVVVWELSEDNFKDDPNPSYYDPQSQQTSQQQQQQPLNRVKRSISSNNLQTTSTTTTSSSSIVNTKYALWNRQIKRLCINNQQFQASGLSTLQVVKGKIQKIQSNKTNKTTTTSNSGSASTTTSTPLEVVPNLDLIKPISQYKVDFYTSNDSRIKDCNSRHWSCWYRNPYFHLFIVQTEDLEIYKSNIKPKLKKWVDYMTERDYEYLICYVSSNTSSGDLFKKFSLFSKVYDKLKSDFGKATSNGSNSIASSSSASRVIKLGLQHALNGANNSNGTTLNTSASSSSSQDDSLLSTSGSNTSVVKEMYTRIHEGILHEFSRRCAKYEEEIKKTEMNMHLPGWQFSQYFIQKEGLSFLLEQFGLFVNSLGIYNQLLGFASSERKMVQYANFFDEKQFKIVNILEDQYDGFRDSMKNSLISEFEFQNYVFSRQMHLFFKLHMSDQVARVAPLHISSLVKRLEQELLTSNTETNELATSWDENTLTKYLNIHAWAYASAFCVAEECYKRVKEMSDDVQRTLYRLCGDIYLYCRYELEILGSVFDMDISWDNICTGGTDTVFDLSLKHVDSAAELVTNLPFITKVEYSKLAHTLNMDVEQKKLLLVYNTNYLPASLLKQALSTQQEFDERMLAVISSVADCYNNGLRNRFYQKLNGDMAAIHFRQGKYVESFKYLKGQLSMYLTDGWYGIATDVLIKMAECTKHMKSEVDYVSSCVDLITSKYTNNLQKLYYWREMTDTLKNYENTISKQIEDTSMWYTCVTTTKQNEACLEMGKQLNLIVTIFNDSLLEEFTAEELSLSFIQVDEDSYHERLVISRNISNTPLKRGKNVFPIDEMMLRLGSFRLERISIKFGKLELIVPTKRKEEELVYNRPFVVVSSEKTNREKVKPKSDNSLLSRLTRTKDTDTQSEIESQMETMFADDDSSSFTTTTMVAVKKDSLKDAFLLLVLESRPTLTIETVKEQLFLLNSVHYFCITVDTKQDLVECGSMSITSLSQNLRVCPDKKGFIIVDEGAEEEIDILDCSISIPKLGTGRRLTYKIPIIATEISKERLTENYNMSFRANYTKQVTRESFKLQKTFEITFYQPFSCECFSTKMSESIYMIQVLTKCITPKPLEISKYEITSSDSFNITKDFNTHLITTTSPMEVFAEDFISYVFEAVVSKPFTPPVMNLEFSIPTQDSAVYHFIVPSIGINEEIDPQFSVDVNCFAQTKNESLSPLMGFPSTAEEDITNETEGTQKALVVGRSCQMSLDLFITKPLVFHNDRAFILEIEADPLHWVLSGTSRIVLDESINLSPLHVEVGLIPLSSGYVALPDINIICKSKTNSAEEKSFSDVLQRNYHNVENRGRAFVLPLSSKDVIFGPLFPVNFPNVDLSLLTKLPQPSISQTSLSSEIDSPAKPPSKPLSQIDSQRNSKSLKVTTPTSISPISSQAHDEYDDGSQWNEGPLGKQIEDVNPIAYTQPKFVTPNIVNSSEKLMDKHPAISPISIPISKIATPPPHVLVDRKLPSSPRPTPRAAIINMRRREGAQAHKRTKSEYLAFSSAEMEVLPQTDLLSPVSNTVTTNNNRKGLAPPLSEVEISEGADASSDENDGFSE